MEGYGVFREQQAVFGAKIYGDGCPLNDKINAGQVVKKVSALL